MTLLIAALGVMLASSAQAEDWTVELNTYCAKKQESCLHLRELPPLRTRAGHYRFAVPETEDDGAALVMLERMLKGGESAEIRSALVPAFGSLLRDRAGLALYLYEREAEEQVRARLVAEVKTAQEGVANELLARGVVDSSAAVREISAAMIGYRTPNDTLTSALVQLLTDDTAVVRAMSARSLGWLHTSSAFEGLTATLDDPDANVRLQALSALNRLDSARLLASPVLDRLCADGDARVASLAKRLSIHP